MQTVSWAGSTYNIPNQRGDTPWSGLSDFSIAVAAKGINTGGGNFTLLADINLGATYGLVSTYYKSRTANIADAGQVRLARADVVSWRNQANGANLDLSVNSSNQLLFNSVLLASAAAALTASRALVSDSSGLITVATTTSTEIGYVNGVTSAIQTQLNSRPTTGTGVTNSLAYYTGAAALAAVTAITASRALASDANGLPVASATTATELGYVAGVTSAIQTQLDGKASTSGVLLTTTDQTASGIKTFSGQLIGKGTTTNDSAAAGYIGETISSSASSDTNAASSGNYDDITSISLTAGDWDVTGMVYVEGGGATWTSFFTAITATSGNDGAGVTGGVTAALHAWVSSSTTPVSLTPSVPTLRISLSGTTTYYLKRRFTYSAGTPLSRGYRLSARRVR